MTNLVIRPLNEGEQDLFLSLPDPGLVGIAINGRDFRETMAAGEYRPAWAWVALRDDRVVARAAWWAGPDDEKPYALDWLDFTDPDAAAALLRSAPLHAPYHLMLPAGWGDHPAVRAAADARIAVAERVGMRRFVHRLRYTWTPDAGLPEPPGRLAFRPEPDDGVVLDVLRRIHEGTLDVHARRDIAELGVEGAARSDLEDLRWFPAPRHWWRLAYTPADDLVGIAVPSRNHHDPIVAFIGVVPEQRGHGYAYDLLVEVTRRLVAEGADRVVADTDTTNAPMAATFTKARYPVTGERVIYE